MSSLIAALVGPLVILAVYAALFGGRPRRPAQPTPPTAPVQLPPSAELLDWEWRYCWPCGSTRKVAVNADGCSAHCWTHQGPIDPPRPAAPASEEGTTS